MNVTGNCSNVNKENECVMNAYGRNVFYDCSCPCNLKLLTLAGLLKISFNYPIFYF